MVESLTGHTREDLEWAIEQLVHTRREYMDIFSKSTNSSREQQHKVALLESKLYVYRKLLDYYLPENHGPNINYTKYNIKWMPYYNITFDRKTFSINTSLDNIKTMFIDHPTDFLKVVNNGGGDEEYLKNRYDKLKIEVEELVERFKTILVSEEFL